MSGGSEPTSARGRCAFCPRTFTLRRSGLSNTTLPVGTLYIPAHHASQDGGPAQCEGSRKPPAPETAAPVAAQIAAPRGSGSGREQLDSMYGGDSAAQRRTDVPMSSLPFGRGGR